MKNRILVMSYIALSFLGDSCSVPCSDKRIPLGLISANGSDSLKIIVDDKVVVDKIIKEDFIGHFQDKKHRLTTLCTNKDSVPVSVKINNRDTVFYLRPKEIKECYVGADVKGFVVIFYNYEVGGFREYDPKR
jgi:hypothetical protein